MTTLLSPLPPANGRSRANSTTSEYSPSSGANLILPALATASQLSNLTTDHPSPPKSGRGADQPSPPKSGRSPYITPQKKPSKILASPILPTIAATSPDSSRKHQPLPPTSEPNPSGRRPSNSTASPNPSTQSAMAAKLTPRQPPNVNPSASTNRPQRNIGIDTKIQRSVDFLLSPQSPTSPKSPIVPNNLTPIQKSPEPVSPGNAVVMDQPVPVFANTAFANLRIASLSTVSLSPHQSPKLPLRPLEPLSPRSQAIQDSKSKQQKDKDATPLGEEILSEPTSPDPRHSTVHFKDAISPVASPSPPPVMLSLRSSMEKMENANGDSTPITLADLTVQSSSSPTPAPAPILKARERKSSAEVPSDMVEKISASPAASPRVDPTPENHPKGTPPNRSPATSRVNSAHRKESVSRRTSNASRPTTVNRKPTMNSRDPGSKTTSRRSSIVNSSQPEGSDPPSPRRRINNSRRYIVEKSASHKSRNASVDMTNSNPSPPSHRSRNASEDFNSSSSHPLANMDSTKPIPPLRLPSAHHPATEPSSPTHSTSNKPSNSSKSAASSRRTTAAPGQGNPQQYTSLQLDPGFTVVYDHLKGGLRINTVTFDAATVVSTWPEVSDLVVSINGVNLHNLAEYNQLIGTSASSGSQSARSTMKFPEGFTDKLIAPGAPFTMVILREHDPETPLPAHATVPPPPDPNSTKKPRFRYNPDHIELTLHLFFGAKGKPLPEVIKMRQAYAESKSTGRK